MISNTPYNIGTLSLKNRFIMAPMATGYASPNGEVTEQSIAYYEARAQGGVALIIVETSFIDQSGKNIVGGLGINTDQKIAGLSRLTDAIHTQGAKCAIQLLHRGRSAFEHITGECVKLVSFVPGLCPKHGRVLSLSEIEDIIESYGKAALRAKKAGFDAVEIHGAHGYLINQFLSPATNLRTDKYGGTPENRLRFALDVIESVRTAVGSSFPLSFRLDTIEGLENGIALPDSLIMAKKISQSGIDVLHITGGITETSFVIPPATVPEAWNAENTKQVRKAVGDNFPIIAVGRYSNPEVAEKILEEHTADFIALGRPLLADPQYVLKYFSGKKSEITRCIACNEGCIGRTKQGLEARCALNPKTSREIFIPYLTQRKTCKKIWVIGAGPAGMEAALTAAEFGKEVTLFEKEGTLGGLLNIASKPPFKKDLEEITKTYLAKLAAHNVSVQLNTEITVSKIQTEQPDFLFVATGSKPIVPSFCKNNPFITTADKVLQGDFSLPSEVLILGGGMVGCETADFISTRGCNVTIIEMKPDLASDMLPAQRESLLARLKKANVRFFVNSEITGIAEDGSVSLKVKNCLSKKLAPSKCIVLAFGYKPDNALCMELDKAEYPYVAIGDCCHVGKIMSAVHSAYLSVVNALCDFKID